MKEKFSEKGRDPYDGLRPYSALTHAVGHCAGTGGTGDSASYEYIHGLWRGDRYGSFRVCGEYAVPLYGKQRCIIVSIQTFRGGCSCGSWIMS